MTVFRRVMNCRPSYIVRLFHGLPGEKLCRLLAKGFILTVSAPFQRGQDICRGPSFHHCSFHIHAQLHQLPDNTHSAYMQTLIPQAKDFSMIMKRNSEIDPRLPADIQHMSLLVGHQGIVQNPRDFPQFIFIVRIQLADQLAGHIQRKT